MASQHLTHCTVYPRLAARADSPWNKEPLGHYGTLCACARRRWHLHRCDAYAPGVGTALDREDTLDTSRSVAGVFSWDSENMVVSLNARDEVPSAEYHKIRASQRTKILWLSSCPVRM